MKEDKHIKQVENFWNNNLCGYHFVKEDYLSKKFFEEYTTFRYKKTHHLNKYIDWSSASGKSVLEIGLGIGADGVRWASYAKSYTGIDITEESVKAAKLHFNLKSLEGTILKADAEQLNMPDKAFDIVYSFGVLHHTQNIEKALSEVNRLLKDDGSFILMLYAKESFNYWVRIQFYFRLRLLLEFLKNKIGIRSNDLWSKHIKNLKEQGWLYISWNNFPHHCTDGPDCEISNTFSKRKIKSLLRNSGFIIKRQIKAHFPLGGKFQTFEQTIGRIMGFHRLIWAEKVNKG